MFIRDAAAATSTEVTPEGFLRVRARIGRSGLHEYRADEIGSPAGFAPGDTVRVYRPPDEVFDEASMASFRFKPVTLDHPPEMVDARNWKRYAIGQSGHEVTREGDHLVTHLLIGDAAGAERALAGAQLSNGYHATFDVEPGTTPEGEPYDAVQRDIRGNHVALVEAGRCGETCRVGDAHACGCGTVEDLRRELAESARALDAKDGEIAALAAAVPDAAALDALVAERTTAVEVARRVFGPAFDPAGRSAADIRALVVADALGPDRSRDRGPAYVLAAFDVLSTLRGVTANPLAHHLATAPSRPDALALRNRHLASAWKGDPQGEA